MRVGVNIHARKRTCHGCVAYKTFPGNDPLPNTCPLGYKIRIIGTGEPYRSRAIPQEKCPKPLTNVEYYDCDKHYRKI